jgi:predicted RNA-binding protein with PIN domain
MENTEIQEVTTLALAVPDQAKQLTVIANNDDYIKAGNILLTIKDLRKKIEASYKKIKQKMDAAKKTVLEEEREQDKPLLEAENWIKPLISSYLAEQEKIRKAEEDRLREQARLAEE